MRRLVSCLLGGMLLVVACSDEPFFSATEHETIGQAGGTVAFRALLQAESDVPQVRGVPLEGTAYPDGASFGTLGYRLPQGDWQTTLVPNFMYNREVTHLNGQYIYESVAYWPAVPVRFFAYHPYASSDNGIRLSPSDYAGNPYLQFSVNDDVAQQVDLLLAAPVSALAPTSVVFPFQHALTRIAFLVKKTFLAGEVKISSIVLKNIIGAGTVSLVPASNGNFVWTPSGSFEDVKEYVLSTPAFDGTDRGLIASADQSIQAGEYQNICSPNGTLFLIPQQITAGRSLLTIQYTVDGDERTQEVLLPATSPGSSYEWSSGKFVRYQLTIDPADDAEEVAISLADARANCILLDPTPHRNPSAAFIEYSIPVLQANVFYDDPAFAAWNEGVRGISAADSWAIDVIWMDKANLLNIIKRNGQGVADNPDGRFTVRIPVGNEGNALVGIYKDKNDNGVKDENETWLWSWHLWVTDYNPNRLLLPETLTTASVEGSWEVMNGKVHRYRDALAITDIPNNNGNYGSLTVWAPLTGLYAGKTIMDRSLGSISEAFSTLENNVPFESANAQQRKTALHVLYYEYGRKDPFLSDAYRYQENGTALNSIDLYDRQINLLFSIQNPEKYIYGWQSWAIDKPRNCYWYDPRHRATAEPSEDTGKKSLFDPCPAGWRLPVNGTWSDYSLSSFRWNSSRRGRVYQPSGTSLEVFYPAEGFRVASSGTVLQTGYHGIYWTCSPIPTNDRDYCFRFTSPEENVLEGSVLIDIVRPSAPVYQTDSFSVRCVQE